MKNFNIRLFLILWILFGSLSIMIILLRAKPEEIPEPTCEVVSGNEHLYRGQCLPEGYIPDNLMRLSPRASWLDTEQYLNVRAKIMVEQLIEEAEKDGMCLVISSGYRSVEEQQELFNDIRDDSVAKPNESEHQTGLAVDFVACPITNGVRDDGVERLELEKPFEELPEYKWLQDNAYKYDMEQSYREDNIQDTYYAVEPWHWKLIVR
jgi:D-alanyl-D-alanine carboxypeptidase